VIIKITLKRLRISYNPKGGDLEPNKRIPLPETVSKEIMELIEKLKEGGGNHKI